MGRECGYILKFSLYWWQEKSLVHSFSLSVKWRRTVAGGSWWQLFSTAYSVTMNITCACSLWEGLHGTKDLLLEKQGTPKQFFSHFTDGEKDCLSHCSSVSSHKIKSHNECEWDIRLVDLGQAINPRELASCGSQLIVQGISDLPILSSPLSYNSACSPGLM